MCIRHSSKHFPVKQRILKPFQWQLSELTSPWSIICQQMRQDATKSRVRIARNDKDFLLPFLLSLKIKEAWLGGVTGSKFHLKKRNFLPSEKNKGDLCKENCVFWRFQGNHVIRPEERFFWETTSSTPSYPSFSTSGFSLHDAQEAILLCSSFLLHALPTGITSEWFLTNVMFITQPNASSSTSIKKNSVD